MLEKSIEINISIYIKREFDRCIASPHHRIIAKLSPPNYLYKLLNGQNNLSNEYLPKRLCKKDRRDEERDEESYGKNNSIRQMDKRPMVSCSQPGHMDDHGQRLLHDWRIWNYNRR
jgi:hypothetical protein